MALLVELAGRRFALELSGTGASDPVQGGLLLPPGRVAVLHGLGDALFYRHGHNSWSPCGWRRLSEPPLRIADPRRRVTADDPLWDEPHRHHSSAVAALQGRTGDVLLLGALGLDTPRLVADQDTLVGWYEQHGAPWFLGYGAEDDVFTAYTDHLARHLGSRHRHAGNVWCSWYAYYENITETQLTKDIAALRGLPFNVVQIDDGWEETVGDWQANDKFPSGMRVLADRIAEAGLVPGLWLAPFIVLPDSDTATRYPEMMLRDERGEPVVAGYNWDSGYLALDLTRSDAREHIAELIDRVVHQWGFRYLKLDFINAVLAPGARPAGTGREQVYRDALVLIREIAGDEVYLLGSGAVLLPSLGLLDGLRSGPDVAPMWWNYASDDPSDAMARNAVVNTLHRLWQMPLVEVDPDVVYFRSRLNLLTDQQLAWLRDLADVCGFHAVSDPAGWLTPDELEAMTRYLSHRRQVKRLDRYRFSLDGREVDFAPVVAPDQNGQRYPIS
jgi:alpha-galactosidase